jgi:Lysozyme like domain
MAILSPREILTFAIAAGFSGDREEAVIATAIALAESGGNTRAHNPNPPDNSFGLWQINMIGKLGPDRRKRLGLSRNEELFDPSTNARAARFVFLDQANPGFKPWTTFTHGTFKNHLAAVRQAATQVDFAAAQVEADLTTEELLDALASARGKKILQDAVRPVVQKEVLELLRKGFGGHQPGATDDAVRSSQRFLFKTVQEIRAKLPKP